MGKAFVVKTMSLCVCHPILIYHGHTYREYRIREMLPGVDAMLHDYVESLKVSKSRISLPPNRVDAMAGEMVAHA